MFYAGRKQDGRFYLGTVWGYQEVSEELYHEYMLLVWREQKARQREFRCNDGRRRCDGCCENCRFERNGHPVSLDQLFDDQEFEAIYPHQKSVEDTVMMKLLVEALYREIRKLSPEDQFLISALFLFEEPLTQGQVGEMLGISQQMVSKRKDAVLATLREALKDWED